MRNILNEKPSAKLYSGAVARARFVDDEDIKEKKVLDIGCGFGWYSLLLSLNMYISKWIFRHHVFLKNYFYSKSTQEYKRDTGFVVIFMKYKKA